MKPPARFLFIKNSLLKYIYIFQLVIAADFPRAELT